MHASIWKSLIFLCSSWLVPVWAPDVGELQPPELSQLPWMRINRLGHNLVPPGKGVVIPSSGECPSLSPKQLLMGMVCVGVYSIHAQLINQCQKATVIQKQVLSVDNIWRNTEICRTVSHADARGSLRRVSWDKEFTPYALNLNIRFISTGLYKAKQASKDTMYVSGLISHGEP